jgi:hypothetical protein
MRLSAAAWLASSVLALGGCNLVVTDAPFFVHDPSAPKLRDGLWRSVEADCRFDAHKSVERWPECAEWTVVRDGETLGFVAADNEQRGPKRWVTARYVVAPGDPLILQQACAAGEGAGPLYCYYAIRHRALDASGRVTQFEGWNVSCGPLVDGGRVTTAPWPGLAVKADGCVPDSADAIRGAAKRTLELNGNDIPPHANALGSGGVQIRTLLPRAHSGEQPGHASAPTIAFTSMNSARPYLPCSRPLPLCL